MGDLSQNPPASVQWYRSQRFIALVQSTILWVLSWFVAALSSNDWAWRAVAIGVATNVLVGLKDWWSPGVIGPAAFMNTTVAPTVSAATVRNAIAAEEKKP